MLKPQNIIQAADMDLRRVNRNKSEAEYQDPHYEHYAFHRKHVHAARDVRELMILALMNPHVVGNTNKAHMRLIYGDAQLLIEAIRLLQPLEPALASSPHRASGG
jgi:hypothetical protein